MEVNKLYFLKDEYFEKYKNAFIDPNKEKDHLKHDRPCYYAFEESGIFWMVPLSSQCSKYKPIYNKALKKYQTCDTIVFGYVKGNENAFLIQNMIPVTSKYINNIYTYPETAIPIEINAKKRKELNAKVRKVLRLSRLGKKLTFTPILEFEKKLRKEMEVEKSNQSLLPA